MFRWLRQLFCYHVWAVRLPESPLYICIHCGKESHARSLI